MWFRGYVRTRNKKCIDKFKDVELKTFDEVKDLPEYAGILAKDTVLIDVDDKDQAEKLLDIIEAKDVICQVRETTRGMHFFFRNNGHFKKCATHAKLAIGLTADIKVGVTNSYSILKFNGEERPIVYDKEPDEKYQMVPKWLTPVKSTMDLLGADEGDGRNDKLFSFILPLQETNILGRDDIIEALDIINRYVFKKPLCKSEFETITRKDAFKEALVPDFYDGKIFLFEKFSKYLIEQNKIKRINGQLHLYRDGVYVDGILQLEKAMIDVIPMLSAAKRTEVFKYIDVLCCDNTPISNSNLIAFRNGIYDIKTGDLLPFDPNIIITNKIDWDYRENAYSEIVDRTLNKLACGDKDVRSLLEEMAGYCFFRRNELRKAFILTGDRANGKSTYINMIGTMLGENNISALDMKDLTKRFINAEIFGKLANLGDDLDDAFIDDVSTFKKFVSGDKVQVEFKHDKPFYFSNYAKFVFSANQLPRVRDRTQAVLDRLIIIPFNATFSKSDPDYDPFIKDKLSQSDSIEYLIKLGIDALKRILERQSFTVSAKVEEARKEYNEENNPVLGFINEYEKEEFTREPIAYWYAKYTEHCLADGCVAMSRRQFTSFILRTYPDLKVKVTKIKGQSIRIFSVEA